MKITVKCSEVSPEYWFIFVRVVPPSDAAPERRAQTLCCLLFFLLLLHGCSVESRAICLLRRGSVNSTQLQKL